MALTGSRVDYKHLVASWSMLSGASLKLAQQTQFWHTAPNVSVLLVRSFRYGCQDCGAPRHFWSPRTGGTSCAHRNRAPIVGNSNRDS